MTITIGKTGFRIVGTCADVKRALKNAKRANIKKIILIDFLTTKKKAINA